MTGSDDAPAVIRLVGDRAVDSPLSDVVQRALETGGLAAARLALPDPPAACGRPCERA